MEYISYTSTDGDVFEFARVIEKTGFESTDTDFITDKGAGQDGETLLDTFLQPRNLSITFDVISRTEAEFDATKRQMLRTLSEKRGAGTLYYWKNGFDATITCTKVNLVEKSVNSKKSTFLLKLRAHDPYFYGTKDNIVQLRFVRKMLRFPVRFPTKFGIFVNKGIVTNDSDAPTPVIIRFYGGAVDPIFRNNRTGEFVGINGAIPENTTLEIETGYRKKRVTLIDQAGNRTNAFDRLTEDSTFWYLGVGKSEIEYIAQGDNTGSTGDLTYQDRYTGV